MTTEMRELTACEQDAIAGATKGGDVGHGKEADLGGGWTVGYGKFENGNAYAYLVAPNGTLTMMPGA
jgi:hypothetical protein